MALSRWIDIGIKLGLLVLSPIFFFLLCEVSVRIFAPQIHGWDGPDPHGTDPVLERIFRPNVTSGYIAADGRRVIISTNSMGFRGQREYGEKDSMVFRIAGLGDSFTNGSGVNDDETYLMVMEANVNRGRDDRTLRVETINMAVDTYGTIKERIFLERYGLRMQPDLITVAFLPNDLWDNIGWLERQRRDKELKAEARRDDISPLSPLIGLVYQLKARSHFIVWLGKKLMAMPGVYRFAYRNRPDKFDYTSPDNRKQIGEAYAVVNDELGRIKHLADSIGARVALISIPLRYQMVTGMDDIKGDIRYLDKLLSGSAEKWGIEFVPLLDTLREAGSIQECYFPMDGHLNRDGHRVVGEYLANWLRSRAWFRGAGFSEIDDELLE